MKDDAFEVSTVDTLNVHEDIVTTPLKVSENRSCGPRTEFSAIADENGLRHSSDSNIICALDKIIVSKFVRADSEFCSKNLRRFLQCRAIHNAVTWLINLSMGGEMKLTGAQNPYEPARSGDDAPAGHRLPEMPRERVHRANGDF